MLKFIAISVVVLAIISYWLLNNKKMKTYRHYMKRRKWLEESIKDFRADDKYINQNMAVAVNYNEKKLCISVMKQGVPATFTYNFSNIKDCEILEDEKAVKQDKIDSELNSTKTAGNSPEALKKLISTTEKVQRIDLKIKTDDKKNPEIIANFLFSEINKGSEDYRILFQDTLKWYKIINNIAEDNNQK
jgi:hypothetical protein